MSNMSYCRFQNTLQDLNEAYNYLDRSDEDLGPEEARARNRLVKLCTDISEQFDSEHVLDGEA